MQYMTFVWGNIFNILPGVCTSLDHSNLSASSYLIQENITFIGSICIDSRTSDGY